jgi:3-dehydroquinate dehydratase/shikimate dehydrogenase
MICVPLTATTVAQAQAEWPLAEAVADLVELRLDYLSDFRRADLEPLLAARRKPVIVTYRPRAEGGRYEGPEGPRLEALAAAVERGAEHVDVELSTSATACRDLLTQARSAGTRVILSFHDFEKMPPLDHLRSLVDEAWTRGADVAKVAGLATEIEDNLTILALVQYARQQQRDLIALAMGAAGRLSRVLTPLFGAYLTFATLAPGRESAPGQMTPAELQQIWELLGRDER